jgi:hypothetical protein
MSHLLAQLLVWRAQHGRLSHPTVAQQHVLQLQAADAVAAAGDHVHAGAAADGVRRRVAL